MSRKSHNRKKEWLDAKSQVDNLSKSKKHNTAICDGFNEFSELSWHCPNCKQETIFMFSIYYDLAKCCKCEKVFKLNC
jgi:hypothetical protein